jgi:dipeptidyl aminopeptidase/acylaminoacyl peptidase
LKGRWGLLDAADIVSCVYYLVSESLVDASRVGITGGSAGGYAVLQALCLYPEVWAGGISLYGVSSLEDLAKETHKFESRFSDGLVLGGAASLATTAEQRQRVFRDRSPLYHAHRIQAPLLLLQGDQDRVVPPSQVFLIEEAIKQRDKDKGAEGGPRVEVILFQGEGHGFIKSTTLSRQKEAEELWWRKTLLRET